MKKALLGFAVGVATTVAVALVSLVAVGHALAVRDPLEHADAIVAISGDSGMRVSTAVQLYKRGAADWLIFSGGSLDPTSVSSAELMERQAIQLGVPEERILVDPAAATTQENAANVAQLMAGSGLRSAILVTSPYHQRRASLDFSREFAPYGLTLRNHPADDPSWDPDLWWTKESSRRTTLIELAKLAYEVVQRSP